MKALKVLWLFLLCVVLVAGLVGAASGQEVFYRDQATLQWDPVTTDASGTPFLPTDVVSYETYIYDYTIGVTDSQDVAQLTAVGTAIANEQLVVFPYRTRWVAGVRAKVTDAGGNSDYSLIAWSVVPVDTNNTPFLYVPFLRVPAPGGLKDSGI